MQKQNNESFILYWEYLAGSIVVQALLEELGVSYRLRYVDMSAGEHLSQDFLHQNPAGRVPALNIPGGHTIGETGAIITLLSEMYPANKITPAPGEKDRATFLFWLNVLTTSGYMTAGRVGHPERYANETDAIAQVAARACADYDAMFDVIEGGISGATFFMQRGLTALDFYITMLTEWHPDREALFAKRSRLANLCEATARTGPYVAAMGTHSLKEAA